MGMDLEKITKWGSDNLTGILAITAGCILLVITYKIILNLIIFSVGAALVYFGFARLKLKVVTDILDALMNKIRSIFSK
jgi:hypothetical protein